MVMKVQLFPLASLGASACSGLCDGEMLWSSAVPSPTVAVGCVAVSSSDSLTTDESQRIDKCEVSCIRRNNFK